MAIEQVGSHINKVVDDNGVARYELNLDMSEVTNEGPVPAGYLNYTHEDPDIAEAYESLSMIIKAEEDPNYLASLSDAEFQDFAAKFEQMYEERGVAWENDCFHLTNEEYLALSETDRAREAYKGNTYEEMFGDKFTFDVEAMKFHEGADYADALSESLGSRYVSMNIAGQFETKYPTAGLTEDELGTYRSIKHSASQESFLKARLEYSDDHFKFDMSGCTDTEKTAYGYLEAMAKMEDPRYLNSLSTEELQTVVTEGRAAQHQFDLLCADQDNPAKAGKEFKSQWESKLRESVYDIPDPTDPKYEAAVKRKEAFELSQATKDDLKRHFFDKDQDLIMADYESRINVGVLSDKELEANSKIAAVQNGFSTLKDKAKDMFTSAKLALQSTAIGSKLIDFGEAFVDKTKDIIGKVSERVADKMEDYGLRVDKDLGINFDKGDASAGLDSIDY